MQQGKKLFRDLIILLLGVVGIGVFFYSFSIHHPFSMGEIESSKERIVERANGIFQNNHYQDFDILPTVQFGTSNQLIDSLQVKWGIKELKKRTENSEFLQKIPLMRWYAQGISTQTGDGAPQVRIELSTTEELVRFTVNNELITRQRPYNRFAIRSVFEDQMTGYSRATEDSLVTALVNFQHLNTEEPSGGQFDQILNRIRANDLETNARIYSEENIQKLASYYIEQLVWTNFDFQQDSTHVMDEAGIRFAKTFWSVEDPDSDVRVTLTAEVMPAGALKSLDYEMFPQINSGNGIYSDILETVSLFVLLIFAIWLLFIFYLRIKARAIDTKPAMVIAVLAGFIVPGIWLLQFINNVAFDIENGSQLIDNFLGLAVLGAISAVGFFVITAVSDSITRQYWAAKLKTWDLVRQGLFLNKPVGWDIINSVAIGGILSGVAGVFIWIFSASYIPADAGFISDNYILPSVANLLVTTSLDLLIVITVFLILGNQMKGMVKNEWAIPVMSALLFCLLDIMPFEIEPDAYDRILRAIVGFILGYFYLRYDFLTIVFGFFVFLNFLSTSKGWVINGSPDANTFYLFILVLLSATVLGIYFVLKGSNREELPEYIPDYIEDQAKEQRLKQELSIAREVQQTFLPSKIYRLPGIDIAGVCIPAQETGGDYYDMIPLGEKRTALAIGDVSGKGIQAAFYMTFTKGVLHSLSTLILSPVELLNQLNRLFNENATRGTFISMIYGILEADKRQFTYARAGHNPMLVVRANGDTEWLKPDGVGIGVTKGDKFIRNTKEDTLKLDEGDVVIMYTDGITEMLNSGKGFYGENRLEKLVKGIRTASSEKILEIIVEDVKDFKGVAKQHDDMTLVIIKADASVNQ
ncbi:PP2C family protein-serine/threonine phosphatase [Gracilimonas sp.]|uniref:PP2C family protein-serine/threonine phosphatase n=1 Tax=Gracilimonas sp. TaxID=1974203 RepID=UPI0028725149|nr:PP2C family protein-serine/threonine phosphatase [Gracilimonas sp.]